MSDAIREKAEALIKRVDDLYPTELKHYWAYITTWDEYKELVASLRPSREEIADNLQRTVDCYSINSTELSDNENIKNIKYAIEELRK